MMARKTPAAGTTQGPLVPAAAGLGALMFSYLMFALAAANAAILAWTLVYWRELRHPVLLLLALMLLALPYDTALVGAGRWIGEGELLESLSGIRFMLFHLTVPLIIVVVVILARLAGLRAVRAPWVLPAAVLVALGFLVADWRSILLVPRLYPACWEDLLRYLPSVPLAQACHLAQPGVDVGNRLPLAALVALPALMFVGVLVWWKRGWPWLFWGVLVALVLLGLPSNRVGPLPGFMGDTLNLVAMVATAVHFLRHPPRRASVRYTML